MIKDKNFLADIAKGMIPRHFISSQNNDRLIYEEDQEVAEMYFVSEGTIGIGIDQFGSSNLN